jgi:outer membrane protein OmpA-like peptidoglycan-associated protein
MFALNSPDGRVVEFGYKTGGIGISIGSKLNLSSSTPDTFSTGQLYLSENFAGAELTSDDIEGFCVVEEVALGAGIGASGSAMLLGIPATSLPAEVVKNTGALGVGAQLAVDHPDITRALLGPLGAVIFDKVREPLGKLLQSNAKALLIMGGFNAGPQLQAGLSGSIGYVRFARVQPVVPPPPPPPEPVKLKPTPRNNTYFLHLPSDVLFDFDKSDLKPTADVVLKEAESQIRAKDPHRLIVEGFTDGIGGAKYNLALSHRRAQSVTNWLVSRKVVIASQIGTYGSGMLKPVAQTGGRMVRTIRRGGHATGVSKSR